MAPEYVAHMPQGTKEHRSWRGIVYIATSLDGYIARKDGSIDFLDPDPAVTHTASVPGNGLQASYDDLMGSIDVLVMGRGTYEKVLTFDSWPFEVPVVVMSTSLPPDTDDRIAVVRSLDEATARLDALASRGVYIDGGQVIQSFLAADLVDEITLTRVPVMIGDGIPLFGRVPEDVRLSLQSVETEGGYLMARYAVVR